MSSLHFTYNVLKKDGTTVTGGFNWMEPTPTGTVYHDNDGNGNYPVLETVLFDDVEDSTWSPIVEESAKGQTSLAPGKCTNPYEPCFP